MLESLIVQSCTANYPGAAINRHAQAGRKGLGVIVLSSTLLGILKQDSDFGKERSSDL